MGAQLIHSNEPQNFDSNIRVMAGPGAGKTHWLIGQLKEILKYSDRLGNCRKIACITYTNKACENIQQKIKFGMDRIEVSTIHAFLHANVIKPYFHLIADQFDFDIKKLDGHDDTVYTHYEFINSVIGKSGCGSVFQNSRVKVSYSKIGQYISSYRWNLTDKRISLEQSGKSYPLYGLLKNKFVNCYKQEVWSQKGIMHDDDVLFFSYQLFIKCPCIKRLISNKFPYILVDEYQDSSSIQHFLIEKLAKEGSYVTVIGDEAQSIYGFAGGDVRFIHKIDFPHLADYTIADNRRSTKSIVDFLNVLRPGLNQKNVREEDYGCPQLLIGPVIQAYNKSKSLCKDGEGKQEDIYTLSWSNQTANEMKIHVQPSFVSKNLFEQLLELSDAHERSRKFIACVKAVENARQMLMTDAVKSLSKGFSLDIRNLDDKKKAVRYLKILCSKYDDYSKGDGNQLLAIIKKSMDSRIGLVRSGKPKELFAHPYLDFAREVNCKEDQTTNMTIHKAKGLEFDNVFVIIESEDEAVDFLINTDLQQKADDHRLFYVACSRASNRLFLSVPNLSEETQQLIHNRFGELLNIYRLESDN